MEDKNEKLILSIDQGTSSSRVLLFSPIDWSVKFVHQKEFVSLYPNEGWSEQDPMLLLNSVKEVIHDPNVVIDICHCLYFLNPLLIYHLCSFNDFIILTVFRCNCKISRRTWRKCASSCWNWNHQSKGNNHCLGQNNGKTSPQCHCLA